MNRTMYQVYGLEVLECVVEKRTEKTITYTLPNGIKRTERFKNLNGKDEWFTAKIDALVFARSRTLRLISETRDHLEILEDKAVVLAQAINRNR